jgi:hypothetical protein
VPHYSAVAAHLERGDRSFSITRVIFLVTALVAASPMRSWASPLVVSNAPTPCMASATIYTTIQAAVNAAGPGAAIHVCPGIYPEQVLITAPLTLMGVSGGNADNPVITAPAGGVLANTTVTRGPTPYSSGAQLLVQNTTNVTIKDLAVDGSNPGIADCNTGIVGIYYQNASGTVNGVTVQNQVGFPNCGRGIGILVETTGTASSTVTIHANDVRFTSGLNIGATLSGTTVTITNNSVVGSNVSLDNGIYVAGGAVGTVSNNTVMNFINPLDALGDNNNGLCGIQVSGSSNVTITGNTIGNTNCAISMHQATNLTITTNKLLSTANNDGVYVCGNNNTVQGNTIRGSDNAGIRLDNSVANFCAGFGNGNTITQNVVNGACVGVLEPAGTTGNIITPNTFNNVKTLSSVSICP